MKKTLLISYFFPPQIGGTENYYLNFCEKLDSDRIVVLTQSNIDDDKFDKLQPYKIYRAEFFGGLISPRWWQLRHEVKKLIDEEGIEQIIFGHFHPLNILGIYFKMPYFTFVHGTDVRQAQNNLWQNMMFKKVYKNCRQIIANSQYIANQVESITKDKSKISIVHPGINFDVFNQIVEDSEINRASLNLRANDLVILSMGRLVSQKNFQTIIKLMPDLLLDFPNLKYIIAGAGPERDNLKKLAYNLGLKDSVKFVGRIDNNDISKLAYYQMADLFVSVSSVAEGFGITYLEAQASGLPVIASKIGGSGEAVANNQTGLLVDPNDLGQIKEAIVNLLKEEDRRIKFSQQAKAMAHDKFDWSIQINKIKDIIK